MLQRVSWVERYSPKVTSWWLTLYGLLLIALAAVVVYRPATLAYVAAAMFVGAGIACLTLAWRLRQVGTVTYRYWREWWSDAF